MAETFLSREEWACPGEESRKTGVASQTVEAQPVFGQIKPSKRRGVRVLNKRGDVTAIGRYKRSVRFQGRKRAHAEGTNHLPGISAPASGLDLARRAPRLWAHDDCEALREGPPIGSTGHHCAQGRSND